MELDSTIFSAIRLGLKRRPPFSVCPSQIFFFFKERVFFYFFLPVALEASVKSMALINNLFADQLPSKSAVIPL